MDVCSTSLTIWKSRNGKHENKKINESYKIGWVGVIHNLLKNKMNLLVDKVMHGRSGTSHDRNIARKFFKNYQESARITGVNKNLMRRFYVILQSISPGFELNIEEFNKYSLDMTKLFVKEYPWYYMSAIVHKILVHGADIVSGAILSIGQLSKEAHVSRNKDLKYCRRSYSRTTSLSSTNEDVFNLLQVSLDPLTSSLRKLP